MAKMVNNGAGTLGIPGKDGVTMVAPGEDVEVSEEQAANPGVAKFISDGWLGRPRGRPAKSEGAGDPE